MHLGGGCSAYSLGRRHTRYNLLSTPLVRVYRVKPSVWVEGTAIQWVWSCGPAVDARAEGPDSNTVRTYEKRAWVYWDWGWPQCHHWDPGTVCPRTRAVVVAGWLHAGGRFRPCDPCVRAYQTHRHAGASPSEVPAPHLPPSRSHTAAVPQADVPSGEAPTGSSRIHAVVVHAGKFSSRSLAP